MMTLLAVTHSLAGTFQRVAAACTSISRALAPISRIWSKRPRVPQEPSVDMRPEEGLVYTVAASLGTTRILFQSASSSSATSMALAVMVP
ncbi:MAG: hypothetical protein QM707_10975 [Arenimonas sp.]